MTVQEAWAAFLSGTSALPYPVHEWAFAPFSAVAFSASVRDACEANLCGRYGKCWTCPPGAGDWKALQKAFGAFDSALLYSTCHKLEDSFDFEGMESGRLQHDALDDAWLSFLGKEASVVLLGAGSCTRCETCTYPDAPCRFPESARRSMEACGIDVVSLSRSLGLRYLNGEATVTYFSLLLFSS